MENEKYFTKLKKESLKKCLYSDIEDVKKPYQSKKLCRVKPSNENFDSNVTYVKPLNLLIVNYPYQKLKYKREFYNLDRFKKPRCSSKNHKHSFSKEEELLWKDINHPKILRSYK